MNGLPGQEAEKRVRWSLQSEASWPIGVTECYSLVPKHLCRERLTEQAGHLSRRIDGGAFIAISLGERSVNRAFSCLFMLSVFFNIVYSEEEKQNFLFVLEVFQELF